MVEKFFNKNKMNDEIVCSLIKIELKHLIIKRQILLNIEKVKKEYLYIYKIITVRFFKRNQCQMERW